MPPRAALSPEMWCGGIDIGLSSKPHRRRMLVVHRRCSVTSSSTLSAGTPEYWMARLHLAHHSLNTPSSREKILLRAAAPRTSEAAMSPRRAALAYSTAM